MNANLNAGLLVMLKVLADESRLSMLRLLNEREHTVGELASRVDLGEPTVSHHLARLREVGLVSLRMAGNQRFYCLNEPGLARFKQMAENIEQMPSQPEPVESDESWIDALGQGWSDEDRQVLRVYTQNGQLARLPGKAKKRNVILRWVATRFEADRRYTETEVNEVIKAVHEADYVALRRDLIDMGYLRRERGGGRYWLAPVEEGFTA
ncbi:metalloregulator ArsR/SmtB family transcription factor [Aggregatilinea lenta]|uniref:metalloregulator ArsR/SmtB family transcription factor n=1 Tax=Aggregatilinea lenta TaxID=913108 RepID=UPI000E5B8746|nr:metalloregulator ArsR/SmtB family transcription factor [Aggregatilinea lenta]